jgi:multidrug transporter EmrE-like cation transporter
VGVISTTCATCPVDVTGWQCGCNPFFGLLPWSVFLPLAILLSYLFVIVVECARTKKRILVTTALAVVLISYIVLLASVNRNESGIVAPIGFVIGFLGFALSAVLALRTRFRNEKVPSVLFISLMLSVIPLVGFLFMTYTIFHSFSTASKSREVWHEDIERSFADSNYCTQDSDCKVLHLGGHILNSGATNS